MSDCDCLYAQAGRRRASAPAKPDRSVPSWPLAQAIETMVARTAAIHGVATAKDARQIVCARLGIHERALYGWRFGDRPTIPTSVADKVLTRTHLLWFDVWTEDTVRVPLFTVTTYTHQMKSTHPNQPKKLRRIKMRRIPYGDVGPDTANLARIESLMTGAPLKAAA